VRFAITDRDSSPAISEKQAMYTDVLRTMLSELLANYYPGSEPHETNATEINHRAEHLARLHYPLSPTTGASFYGALVQHYTIRMYEEEIAMFAHSVTARYADPDLKIKQGTAQSFGDWKSAWDHAGTVKNGPHQGSAVPYAILIPQPR